MILSMCFGCAGVTISGEVDLPAVPRVGDDIAIELQLAKVKAVTWRIDCNKVMVHAEFREWNGSPCVPDRELWGLLRKVLPVSKWYWNGNFPRQLEIVCQEEFDKK